MARDGYGLWLGGYLRRITVGISALLVVGVLGFNFATTPAVPRTETRPHYVAIPHIEHPDLARYREPSALPDDWVGAPDYYVCDPPNAVGAEVQTCWPTIIEGPGY